MKGFKKYITEDEAVEKTLAKLPAAHQKLAADYKFQFEGGNTLDGHEKHVGMVTTGKKVIRVAAPWNYGREFTVLHEIAHLVYDKFVRGTDLEKKWKAVADSVKANKKGEPPEELFCHAYASAYCKNPVVQWHHPKWVEFIKDLLN